MVRGNSERLENDTVHAEEGTFGLWVLAGDDEFDFHEIVDGLVFAQWQLF